MITGVTALTLRRTVRKKRRLKNCPMMRTLTDVQQFSLVRKCSKAKWGPLFLYPMGQNFWPLFPRPIREKKMIINLPVKNVRMINTSLKKPGVAWQSPQVSYYPAGNPLVFCLLHNSICTVHNMITNVRWLLFSMVAKGRIKKKIFSLTFLRRGTPAQWAST